LLVRGALAEEELFMKEEPSFLMAAIPALIAFSGVAVGAILNFFFQKAQKATEAIGLEKQKVYSNFLESLGEYAILSRGDAPIALILEKRAKLTAAKAKVCVYGSKSVVNRLGKFEMVGNDLSQQNAKEAFIELIEVMRNDVGLLADKNDLDWVLLGGTTFKD
jgi:hypothetical protein